MVTYREDETQRPEGWNKGAPPHVGWWAVHASWGKLGQFHAWWDGNMWSYQTCDDDEDCSYATDHLGSYEAGVRGNWSKWSWTWPEHARVARVNPETGEVTGSGPCPYETDGQAWPFVDVKKKAADAPKLKKKPAGNRKVTRYVLMLDASPVYVADSLKELKDRIKARPYIFWTHYEQVRNRKKA